MGDVDATAIAIHRQGNAFVTGFAGASFPTSRHAIQKTNAGGVDAFVVKVGEGIHDKD
jgi:hypothetical protein